MLRLEHRRLDASSFLSREERWVRIGILHSVMGLLVNVFNRTPRLIAIKC